VQDVFAASVQDVAWKNVVISQPCPRRDSRHVIDHNGIHDGSFARYSSRDASCVCAVILDCLCVQTLLAGFVIENLGDDNFWRDVFAVLILMMRSAISCIALWKIRRIAESQIGRASWR